VIRIGVVGTGFIAQGFITALKPRKEFVLSRVLTRRDIDTLPFTNSMWDLIDHSDLVVECSGDVIHAANVVNAALEANLPVVTMNSEFHVTCGTYFAAKGFLTEAEGDQPGCLAALKENVIQMGFQPVVYGNIKRFLNHNPTYDEMLFWSKRYGISLQQAISFTDGTKVQIEQALVANGLGATILKDGLLGLSSEDVYKGARVLAVSAERIGSPISDYVLSLNAPRGVFVVARHDEAHQPALEYLGLGEGPYYVLLQEFHLCYLEILKTIKRVISGGSVLLNNSLSPKISVAAIAKKNLSPGYKILTGIGSFDVRGVAVELAETPQHVPIGLLSNAVVVKPIEQGEMIKCDQVNIPESLALKAWKEVNNNAE